jgi:hypothetical protein
VGQVSEQGVERAVLEHDDDPLLDPLHLTTILSSASGGT